MQIFELYFNPRRSGFSKETKSEREIIFDSFCYEPENIYEKKLGGLYILGELKNVLPQNLRFLEKISQVIKEKYYSNYLKSPEQAMKESLKSLNEFFAQEIKNDNTGWMGNLDLAIISATPQQKLWVDLSFTKIGELKILLLRQGQVSDIGTKLNPQEIEPYPLRVFSHIVSGKIAQTDIIAIFTNDVFSAFAKESNLIQKIAEEKNLNDKKIKEILKPAEEELAKISGICLLIQAQPEIKTKTILAFEKKFKSLSISQILPGLSNRIKNSYQFLTLRLTAFRNQRPLTKLRALKIPKFTPLEKATNFKQAVRKLRSLTGFTLFKINLPQFILLRNLQFLTGLKTLAGLKTPFLSKNIILVFILIFFLLSGSFLAQKQKERETQLVKERLQEIELKINRAENFLILKDEGKANILFQESLNAILPLLKKEGPLSQETLALKNSIEKALNDLNKLEKIEEPEILFEFELKTAEFIPSKILLSNSGLYFYNPFSSKIYKFELKKNELKLLKGENNLQFGISHLDSVLFFSRPNLIISLSPVRNEISNGVKNDEFQERNFELPDFQGLASFGANIYFLDSKAGEIIKYSPASDRKRIWLNPQTKKPILAKSIAIDGSIWILTKENEINRYHRGVFRETLKLNLFPHLKRTTKIWTSQKLPYLYLLEPNQNRIIILTKEGEIIKQYQSEKFDNLLDFAVSEDGKTIYLLNGLRVYKILL